MLIHLACLISTVVPQAPAGGPEGDADAAIAHAGALPSDTLVAVSLRDVARAARILGESDFWRGLRKAMGSSSPLPEDPAAFLQAWSERAATVTGLPAERWTRLLAGRTTFAVTELRASAGTLQPGWLVAAETGGSGPFSAALEKMAVAAGAHVESLRLRDGTPAWSVRLPEGPSGAWAFTNNGLLLAADSQEALESALARLRGRGHGSLAELEQVRAFTARVAPTEPQVTCFVQTGGLLQLAAMRTSAGQAARVRRVLAGLGLHSLQSVGFSLRLRRREVEEIVWLGLPAPRDGLLGTLLSSGEPLGAADADAIPQGVASFSIVQIPLGEVVEQALELARGSDATTSGMVDRALASLRSRTGVDPQSDLLDLLGPRILHLEWVSSAGAGVETAVVMEVAREPDRLTTALTRLSKSLPVPVRRRRDGDATVFSVGGNNDDQSTNLAVTADHLVLATSTNVLRRVLEHLRRGRPDPRARRILADLSPATTWVSWAREGLLESTLRRALAATPAAGALPRGLSGRLATFTRHVRGPRLFRLEVERHGLALRITAPFSHVLATAALGLGALRIPTTAKSALPHTPTGPDPASSTEPVRRRLDRNLYDAIVAAERSTGPADSILEGLLSTDARIVARAAYAAKKRKLREAVQQLSNLVMNHPSLEVRRHAMAALLAIKDPRTTACSLRALESDDATLRALAAANLGRLRHRAASDALVDLVGASTEPDAPDRVQAVLALTDLGDPSVLLAVAASVETDGESLDQALAYLFQTLSPRLPRQEEVKTLMAVLDHPSLVVRRYAIQRLGQLRDPICLKALEGRLGKEGDTLHPLIEVSLQAIRGAEISAAREASPQALKGARKAVRKVVDRIRSFVRDSSDLERAAALGGFFLLTIGGAGFLLWRDRRKRRQEAEQWAAMVAPSEEFEESQEPDAEDLVHHGPEDPFETFADESEGLAPEWEDDEPQDEESYVTDGDEIGREDLEFAPSLHDEFGSCQDDVLEVPLAAEDDIGGEPDLLRRNRQ